MTGRKTLKDLRIDKRLTQQELAEITGLHVITISNLERGIYELPKSSGETLRELALALEVSVDELLEIE